MKDYQTELNSKELEALVGILNSVNSMASTQIHLDNLDGFVEERLSPREIDSLHEKLLIKWKAVQQ
tara:strand:+ start:345 stop:542 length:198 start_codon:yes stop_codon:yes gene_type:complete